MEAPKTAAFQLENVRRVHGEGGAARAALDGVSLTIEQGSFVAVVGPSGSGKSTLLTILGALDQGYEGRVLVLGKDLAALGERQLARLRNEHLGFVFQAFHLLPHLTTLENVLCPSLFAQDASGAEQAAREALARVGLKGREQDRPQHLSGGQRQRVALARALMRSPPILLCDEPTGNLDSRTGAEVIELLASLQREDGKTVVVVTHEERLAARTSQQIELIDGKIAGQP